MAYPEALQTFRQLQVGDRIECRHQVRVGFRDWTSVTTGTVIGLDRRRHSLHFRRNFDDKVFSDIIKLRRDDGELTTITIDEFTDLKILSQGTTERS